MTQHSRERKRPTDSDASRADSTPRRPFPWAAEPGDGARTHRVVPPVVDGDGFASVRDGAASCPACAAPAVNGAGLYACTTCKWVGAIG